LPFECQQLEPKYDTKPAYWMARELGPKRLGLEEYFPLEEYRGSMLDWQLKQVGSSLEEMQRIGVKTFEREVTTILYMAEGEEIRIPHQYRKNRTLQHRHWQGQVLTRMPKYTPHEEPPQGLLPA
jgi:thiosulfate reductase/polysulfide reductase chain A